MIRKSIAVIMRRLCIGYLILSQWSVVDKMSIQCLTDMRGLNCSLFSSKKGLKFMQKSRKSQFQTSFKHGYSLGEIDLFLAGIGK